MKFILIFLATFGTVLANAGEVCKPIENGYEICGNMNQEGTSVRITNPELKYKEYRDVFKNRKQLAAVVCQAFNMSLISFAGEVQDVGTYVSRHQKKENDFVLAQPFVLFRGTTGPILSSKVLTEVICNP